jgi:hypothetical protein
MALMTVGVNIRRGISPLTPQWEGHRKQQLPSVRFAIYCNFDECFNTR